jgi:hypothetical protein
VALKNTHPLERSLRAKFNLLTRSGSSLLRSLPFGGAVGVVVAGAVLWFAPRLVPAGWGAEAVLSLGMGGGIVLHRLIDALLGWFFDPVERHLRARWEAAIRLAKLARYRKQGLIAEAEAQSLQRRIVQDDVSPKKRR